MSNEKLTLTEKARRLSVALGEARNKPFLQKADALESVIDDAISLLMDMAGEVYKLTEKEENSHAK